jgi:hypothetical protein
LGYPVPERNKYRNLALLVEGVSKIETIKIGKSCAAVVRQKLKSTDPTSPQRGHPTSVNPKLSKVKS